MATQTLLSVEEYLRTSFDGTDVEYVDGELVERGMPDDPHSATQVRLIELFHDLRKHKTIYTRTELRVRVSPKRCRVIDVAVFLEPPSARYPSTPPWVAIEIVSEDDRMSHIIEKFEDYRRWGVAHIWLIDPRLRRLYLYDSSGLREVPALAIPEAGIGFGPAELF